MRAANFLWQPHLQCAGGRFYAVCAFPKIFFRKKIMPPREFDANLLFFTALGGEGRDGVAVRVEQADVRLCPWFPQVPYAIYI